MLVQISKLDSENEILTVFSSGNHVLGRGDLLQCNDKRVSRQHAALEVSETGVKLVSTHVNPCFLKAAEGTAVTVLSKDNSYKLENGDKFAFLPDTLWFKVKFVSESDSHENGVAECSKRTFEDEEEPQNKKFKGDEANSTVNTEIKIEPEEANNTVNTEIKIEPEDSVKQETTDEDNAVASTSSSTLNQAIKEETKDQGEESDKNKPDSEEEPSSITKKPKQRRERCWYGAGCYRKNPNHFSDFTHPGDSDYLSDPEDDRPSCSFGADCYRRNRDHRRDFKHPPGKPAKKKRKLRKRANNAAAGYSDDDSDEDPFVDDGDSDEYVNDDGSSDSDWEDSQAVTEESEEIRTLVREAKRFKKK